MENGTDQLGYRAHHARENVPLRWRGCGHIDQVDNERMTRATLLTQSVVQTVFEVDQVEAVEEDEAKVEAGQRDVRVEEEADESKVGVT